VTQRVEHLGHVVEGGRGRDGHMSKYFNLFWQPRKRADRRRSGIGDRRSVSGRRQRGRDVGGRVQ
jgi:hypothetical protein